MVGAGKTAARKLRWLVRAGAQNTVIAPQIDAEIQRMHDAEKHIIERREFYPEAIHAGPCVVISATNAPQVSELAFARALLDERVLVNCVDRTELRTIISLAMIDRFPILVAVSSMGQSPTLSRSVRGWIETRLPQGLGRLAERLRSEVK